MASNSDSSEISHLSWTNELEAVLLGSTETANVRAIAQCRVLPDELRAAAWLSCLEIDRSPTAAGQTQRLTSVYDLPEQSVIRQDICDMVERLGNDESDRVSVMSDVESVLTHYCKSHRLTYDRSNGWLDVLQPLVSLRLDKHQLYAALTALLQQYIPKNLHKDGDAFHLLRLLLLYHDPELCNFLDTRKINPDCYSHTWFASLFSACCSLKMIHTLWDIYFQMDDPFLVFFLSLVILVNAKDQIMEMRESSREQITSTITSLPSFLEQDDLQDFCELACFYSNTTPRSFRRLFYSSLFGVCTPQLSSLLQRSVPLSQSLCLPVYADEVTATANNSGHLPPPVTAGSHDDLRSLSGDSVGSLERSAEIVSLPETADAANRRSTKHSSQQVEYFLVDCRPADQYNSGHLSTAFHLDCSLMLSEPDSFTTAVHVLMSVRQQAASANTCKHICFIGSGDETEDKFLYMVIASFLQKGTSFVSKLEGGYQALHDLFSDNLSALIDHTAAQCKVCCSSSSHNASASKSQGSTGRVGEVLAGRGSSLLGLLGGANWRRRGLQMRDKLVDIITNAPLERQQQQQQQQRRHVSSEDKGRRYRNVAPIFSLGDDDETDEQDVIEAECTEPVQISEWLKKPEVLSHFPCHLIRDNHERQPSVLLVTGTQLVVLRQLADREDWAHVVCRRSLSSVVQITSKKRRPELITFKYGVADGDTVSVTDLDRFHIVKAGDATKAVKMAIVQLSQPDLLINTTAPSSSQPLEDANLPISTTEDSTCTNTPD